jgi:hypothetical protein
MRLLLLPVLLASCAQPKHEFFYSENNVLYVNESYYEIFQDDVTFVENYVFKYFKLSPAWAQYLLVVAKPDILGWQGENKISGLYYGGKYRVVIYNHGPCIARTSLVHELVHFINLEILEKPGDQEFAHSDVNLWEEVVPNLEKELTYLICQ